MAYKIEILMSTMFRTDLTFLEPIFKHNKHFSNYNILIVNQTDADKLLTTDYETVKVINSFKRGVPMSRNLAISKATGDICLMADDDIVYEPNFDAIILNAYIKNPYADFISFEAVNEYGKPYANYDKEGLHNKKSLKKIYTWVMTFRRKGFIDSETYYNSFFGFNVDFQSSEEYIFLRNAYDKGLKMYHESETIVTHPEESSGRRMGSDNAFYGKAAVAQRFYGHLSYIWLLKYTLYMIGYKHIAFKESIEKFKLGLRGISRYKALKRSGEIDKIYDC